VGLRHGAEGELEYLAARGAHSEEIALPGIAAGEHDDRILADLAELSERGECALTCGDGEKEREAGALH
jgi:hypothetical protein